MSHIKGLLKEFVAQEAWRVILTEHILWKDFEAVLTSPLVC